MLKTLQRLNLTQTLLVFLVLTSILPMFVTGVVSYRLAQVMVMNGSSRYTRELVFDQKETLDLGIGQVENLVTRLAGMKAIGDLLANPDDPVSGPAAQEQINTVLSGDNAAAGLVSIDLILPRGIYYQLVDRSTRSAAGETKPSTGGALDPFPVPADRADFVAQVFAMADVNSRPIAWMGMGANLDWKSANPQVISLAAVLWKGDLQTLTREPAGLLLVNYTPEYLNDHFAQVNLGKGAYLSVIDAQNRIVYHPASDSWGKVIETDIIQKMTGQQGSFTVPRGGQTMVVTYQRSERNGWGVLSFIPLSTLIGETAPIRTALLLILAIFFSMVALSSGSISRSVVTPIREITRRFRMFQEGLPGWKAVLPARSQQDEISELMQWFNIFLESLEAKEKAEIALRESEERYSLALRGANDGIWDWDLRTDTIHYSTRWKSMLGCVEEDIGNSPQDWFDRVHPEDLDRLKGEIVAHLDGVTSHFENEHRLFVKSEDAYRWFLARGLAVKDAGQKAHRMAGSLTDVTERKQIEERLRYDSLHDPLTNLGNRAYFMTQLTRAIEHAKRHAHYQAAVLFMDLDRFKIVNDSLGHTNGDQLLVAIAQRLSFCLRREDTVARFGGDEFAILIESISGIGHAIQVANRVQEQLTVPFKLKGHEVFTSVSIGIALVSSSYNQPDELMRDADTAMYRAKSGGRAKYEIFDYQMHASTLTQLQLEADLRRAVAHQELQVYYQPIVALSNGEITNVEALIRWQHPDRGLVSPGEFIPLAEETGLIIPIGEWVLKTACEQVRILQEGGYPDLVVNVNITARQLQAKNFPDTVRKAIRDSGIDSHSLELEISENAAMADLAQTTRVLDEIKALGVGISIDDFGTGYSSLEYLKRFPIDVIKIDRSFVKDSIVDPDDAAITTAIIAMGHILGLGVVGEGVENQDQLNFLINQGCDSIQGFLFIPPVPIAILLNIFRNGVPALTHTETQVLPAPVAPGSL